MIQKHCDRCHQDVVSAFHVCQSTSAICTRCARACHKCGGLIYEGMTHHCSTSAQP